MNKETNLQIAPNPALNIASVMPCYFYQDESDVKENDIVFYSEDGGDHKFHYADSIGIIVKRENDLKMKSYVITMDDYLTNYLPEGAEVIHIDGSYAEILYEGKDYGVYAVGNGDSFNHHIRFELL